MTWLKSNLSTIVIMGLIIRSMVRDKKNGKSSCGGNCGGCSGCSACHPTKK